MLGRIEIGPIGPIGPISRSAEREGAKQSQLGSGPSGSGAVASGWWRVARKFETKPMGAGERHSGEWPVASEEKCETNPIGPDSDESGKLDIRSTKLETRA